MLASLPLALTVVPVDHEQELSVVYAQGMRQGLQASH